MSHTTTPLNVNSNSSLAIQNALNSLAVNPSPINTNVPFTHAVLSNNDYYNKSKVNPTFKLELFKAENGGFVMHLVTTDRNTYTDKTKMFILGDIQNMGRDIQNILAAEVLKS